ncbi:putative gustatory receptor clone PTE03 [Bufo gargarizans]|uniref:putative gustatory receptor clone PTE03 n=1 Tax=Bufo gargarizans TaxID=30331 RepID=UPI001CF5E768|nr:putative gustatory receptor clone PTE03 [Bufo gargarizans]
MENGSSAEFSFELLGLLEMEGHKVLYCVLSLVLYFIIIVLSGFILYLVLTEVSLHKPMYLLICNLLCNGVFGSCSFFPKLLMDLSTSSKTTSRVGCIIQSFSVSLFAFYEILTFTIMAYDQYLAVCHPLQYITLMTNKKVAHLLTASLVASITVILVAIILTTRVPLCGTQIKNIFCDNMSIFILACTDTSINNIYGGFMMTTLFLFSTIFIVFSYIKIYLICRKLSLESSKKAMHTLVTHLINFSIFLIGVIFVCIRYRISNFHLPISGHILLSTPSLVLPPLLNPLVFGVRMKALKAKMILQVIKLKKMDTFIKS